MYVNKQEVENDQVKHLEELQAHAFLQNGKQNYIYGSSLPLKMKQRVEPSVATSVRLERRFQFIELTFFFLHNTIKRLFLLNSVTSAINKVFKFKLEHI